MTFYQKTGKITVKKQKQNSKKGDVNMIIPKYLQRPNMTEDEKRRLIAWIKTKREKMRQAPTFDDEGTATKAAVRDLKQERVLMPTVWQEPRDIGQKYAVVAMGLREDAQISGYTETVDFQRIFDIANGRGVDEIEEV